MCLRSFSKEDSRAKVSKMSPKCPTYQSISGMHQHQILFPGPYHLWFFYELRLLVLNPTCKLIKATRTKILEQIAPISQTMTLNWFENIMPAFAVLAVHACRGFNNWAFFLIFFNKLFFQSNYLTQSGQSNLSQRYLIFYFHSLISCNVIELCPNINPQRVWILYLSIF